MSNFKNQHKMKKTTILFAAIALLLSSCNDFLDLNPKDKPSSGTFWKTADDYKLALTACYGTLQGYEYSYGLPNWDNLTDNGFGQHNYSGTNGMAQGNIDPSSGGYVSDIYSGALKNIARTNIFLKNLSEFKGIDDAAKKRSEAEARMIRAFFYSYLYRCYGDVPVVSEPLTLENQFQEKKPAADVYKFMMDDIDFAIANLPSGTYGENKGRWTKDAAKAYKARMILYTAYDKSGVAVAAKMSEAKNLLSEIKGYSLAPDFSDNFLNDKQEACPEIMMSVKFLAPNNSTQADMWYGDWVVVSPLANLISEFEMKDGSAGKAVPYTGKGVIDLTLFSNASLAERDSRLAKTVFIDEYIINGVTYTPSNKRPLGTGLSKFFDPKAQLPYDYPTKSHQDWVVMRYADVLLMLAEAENELSGASALAYKCINDIRVRSGMPELPAGLSKDDMRKRIRHERRVELAFEGERYFDLKRWRIAKEVLNNVQDGLLTYKFEDKHYLWPLPQSEIDKNNGVLIQNSDYK